MSAWERPEVPSLPGVGAVPAIFDSQSERLITAQPVHKQAKLYVCGVTPYDATHLGHAFTYLTYDILLRAWRDSGIDTIYVQNVTDIDDPLLERAKQTGVRWQDLAGEQLALFESDMAALRMLPPDHFVSVTQAMSLIQADVERLRDSGFAYTVHTRENDSVFEDYYFDITAAQQDQLWQLGHLSHLNRSTMLSIAAERGGDPNHPGKRDPLDPCLWRAARPDEPSWESALGAGRPGWHIECASIALHFVGSELTVQGGGTDLQFPHHEMSAAHAQALSGHPLAHIYAHSALVGYAGEKMSKSRGNLVFVSRLRADGFEPDAIRLALLQHHYRTEWEWFDVMMTQASSLLGEWRALLDASDRGERAETTADADSEFLAALRGYLADDLNTPAMIRHLDECIRSRRASVAIIRNAADALLGIRV